MLLKKYGVENFKFEVLEYCEKEQMDELEIKYIAEYDCTIPNGYNISTGGKTPIYSSEEIKNEFIKSGEDHFWFNKNLPKEIRNKMSDSNSGENNAQAKQVEDITGRIWGCLKDCAKELDVRSHDLSAKLNRRPTFLPHLNYLDLHFLENRPENYIFKTMEEIEHLKIPKKIMKYKKPKEEWKQRKLKRVISNDGRIWESVSDCAREFGMSCYGLSRILKGLRKPVEEIRQYDLKYEDPTNIEKVYQKPREYIERRSVRRQVVDKDGIIYNSIRDCANHYGIHENKLSSMLRGVMPFKKNLIQYDIRYVDPEYKQNNWKDKESLGKNRIGTKNSDEVRKKISDSVKGENHSCCKKVIDNTGRSWYSCNTAAEFFNISPQSLGKMLLGKKQFRDDLINLDLKYA